MYVNIEAIIIGTERKSIKRREKLFFLPETLEILNFNFFAPSEWNFLNLFLQVYNESGKMSRKRVKKLF